jgi:F-type H+-transporting ATPase subunit b
MNIIPDLPLVLVQFFPFFVVIVGLQQILFKPMMAYLHERNLASKGAKADAEALMSQAENRVAELEAALAKAQQEVVDFRAARRAEANAEYQQIVAEARKQAEAKVSKALGVVQADSEAARSQLGRESASLAHAIAERALGRSLSMEG